MNKTNESGKQEQKEGAGGKKVSYKETFRNMFSLNEDVAPPEEIRDRLLSGGKITGTNMVVMVCAILIASVGLNTDSVAVIIGAMLISPLMGSILAMGYGTASNDLHLTMKHLMGFCMQILFSVGAATIYFLISPVKEPTAQLIARTSPGFFDVIIALVGGVAGIVGQTRADKANNIIPGVAIATALMPPLCTVGYSLANGEWKMMGGAAYLFIINTYFIYLASCTILTILKVPTKNEMTPEAKKKLVWKMWRNTILVILPMIVVLFTLK